MISGPFKPSVFEAGFLQRLKAHLRVLLAQLFCFFVRV